MVDVFLDEWYLYLIICDVFFFLGGVIGLIGFII